MRLHLGDHAVIDADGLWAPLESVAAALDMVVDRLDGAGIGLCPAPDVCVPVPPSARRGDLVDVEALAAPLGLAVAHDGHRAVVLPGRAPRARTDTDGAVDLVLPGVRYGEPVPLAVDGRRTVVFAWASW